MVYFAANSDPEAIRTYLKRLQAAAYPEEDMRHEFTGVVVYARAQNNDTVTPKAVFNTSKKRRDDGAPKRFALSLREIADEILKARELLKTRPAVSRTAKVNLPVLIEAYKKLKMA